jgi:hypothetical protein
MARVEQETHVIRNVTLGAAFLAFAPWCLFAQSTGSRGQPVPVRAYGPAARPAESWSLSLRPRLDIGGSRATESSQFSMVAGIIRLADGSFAVADGDSREIRVFDLNGTYRRTFGGRGNGPGELTSIGEVWRTGGEMVVRDGQGRSQVFTQNGNFVRSFTPPHSAAGVRPRSRGYLGDGSLVVSYTDQSATQGNGRRTLQLTLIRIKGENEQVLGRFPAYEVVLGADSRPRMVVYGPALEVALLARSYCVGYSAKYSLRCYDPSGRPQVEVTRTVPQGRRINDADRQLYYEGIDAANPGPRGADYRKEVREMTVFAERLPAFGRIVGSANDEIWVGPLNLQDETLGILNPSPPGPTTWSVFSLAGVWLSDVALPARFRLMDAGVDYVAGVRRDIDDVEHLVVYDLIRRR